MKKRLIAIICAIFTIPANHLITISNGANIETADTFSFIFNLSDEEFLSYYEEGEYQCKERLIAAHFGDDSVDDEVKFDIFLNDPEENPILSITPSVDKWVSEEYNYRNLYISNADLPNGYVPCFYISIDETVPLDPNITADRLGFSSDWNVSCVNQKFKWGDSSDYTVFRHEYRVDIPIKYLIDFESYIRLFKTPSNLRTCSFDRRIGVVNDIVYGNLYWKEFIPLCTAADVIDAPVDETFKPDIIKGDVNNDKMITVADAVLILQYLGNADKYWLSPKCKSNADVDDETGITTNDAVTLQKNIYFRDLL